MRHDLKTELPNFETGMYDGELSAPKLSGLPLTYCGDIAPMCVI